MGPKKLQNRILSLVEKTTSNFLLFFNILVGQGPKCNSFFKSAFKKSSKLDYFNKVHLSTYIFPLTKYSCLYMYNFTFSCMIRACMSLV
jgi:hypothetical protein